ncbi:MAG: response regulator transcription factor [Chthoniobacterales bacterium]|nr:response regulator transcription factor [Chthoniobacterales bacterium]
MKTLKILIADDHEVLREGARMLIEAEAGWEVCGVAANGREALERARELEPDIIVLDLNMPELSGVDAVRQLKRAVPACEILVFSAHRSEDVVEQVFDAGAKSYIQKADAGRDLISAIRSLAEHKPYFTPDISEIVFRRFLHKNGGKADGLKHDLTAREREILRLLAEGQSNKDVATNLGISVRTAETHRAALMHKLSLDSIASLVRYAIRNQIIEA